MSAETASTPHGWLEDDEARWLSSQAYDKELVIEFGSWCGKSSLALAAARRLVCVDTWIGTPNDVGNHSQLIDDGLSPISEWRSYTRHLPNIVGIVGNLRDPFVESLLVASYKGKADMVFIDADHSVDAVTKDIWLAKGLLKKGGILCGHDYHHSHPGVVAAVSTLLPHRKIAAGTIWTA